MSIMNEDNLFLEENYLEEGFWSQWFKGHDDDLLDKYRGELKDKIKTESDRRKALEEIDDAIDNSNRVITNSDFKDWAVGLGLNLVPFVGMWTGLARVVMRLSDSDKRKAFREALHKARHEITSLKLKD